MSLPLSSNIGFIKMYCSDLSGTLLSVPHFMVSYTLSDWLISFKAHYTFNTQCFQYIHLFLCFSLVYISM